MTGAGKPINAIATERSDRSPTQFQISPQPRFSDRNHHRRKHPQTSLQVNDGRGVGAVRHCYNAIMKTARPDIVVISPDGEYLMVVEVKLNDNSIRNQNAVDQLRCLMASIGCSVGLVVSGERIILLHDSLEKSHGESIDVVGEARLPDSLLPPADEQWKGERGLEFESRVQRWLEKLKLTSSTENLPNDLRELLGEPIMRLLRLGEVRAASPRWSKVAR